MLKKIEEITGTELREGYAPTMLWLAEGHYSGFLTSIGKKDFDYRDVVERAGLKYPAGSSDPRVLGTMEH